MKETHWNDCITNLSIKTITPDRHRAEYLIETARERLALITKVHEKNCNFSLKIIIPPYWNFYKR